MTLSTPMIARIVSVLALLLGMGGSVLAGAELPPISENGEYRQIHVRQRLGGQGAMPAATLMPVRDPFFGDAPQALSVDLASAPSLPMALPVDPPFPAFRVIGKLQDEQGWAVFISESGKQGPVWVVREGDSFSQGFKVSKLAPPQLIIRRTRGRQSRTLDIGKDELEE